MMNKQMMIFLYETATNVMKCTKYTSSKKSDQFKNYIIKNYCFHTYSFVFSFYRTWKKNRKKPENGCEQDSNRDLSITSPASYHWTAAHVEESLLKQRERRIFLYEGRQTSF